MSYFSMRSAYHSTSVALHELHHASRVFVPQVNVSTVTSTHYKLTARAVEVHAFHYSTHTSQISKYKIKQKQRQKLVLLC